MQMPRMRNANATNNASSFAVFAFGISGIRIMVADWYDD
ncbi:MAG: hypothetical protein UY50_C0008G0027 [Parcubacteria group bacterium GW2011_GWA2_49_9]|nr:MAG: hypothetical protein UY50_C0008G0027 [Parcubacteria group bacterium GW2011_GWA2_49_9]